ncbi:LysM domain-containing protein [Klenkia terrae]|uniref:LysM domain-containing protein n=1 Tax=Klenkia terrae TaxID=1052259 RepID=A0ABU8E3D0_9ACTN
MTMRRWATTTVVMAVVGVLLWAAAPDPGTVAAATTDPQRLVDTQGPDALVTLLAWALAAACWCWGSLGLLLTAASAAPGLGGRLAGALLTVVLPAGLRRAAALAVGVSLVAAPGVALGSPGPTPSTTAVSSTVSSTLSSTVGSTASSTGPATAAWSDVGPAAAPPVPDWPAPVTADEHVVVRGDCLWDIAAAWLATRGPATDDQVQDAVQAWWQTNADVVGPDPDLLLPGQVLRAPPLP